MKKREKEAYVLQKPSQEDYEAREDIQSSLTVIKMNENLKVKYDEEYLSNDDRFQLLQ